MRRIVSGGQTGVDRAALDVGRRLGIAIGGWCPAGGWAEDLPEPPGLLGPYPELRPTASDDRAERTRGNVRDSTATLVITRDGVASPGSALTIAIADELDRPHLVVQLDSLTDRADATDWLSALTDPVVLNVAGPRESEAPGIYVEAVAFLEALLGDSRA